MSQFQLEEAIGFLIENPLHGTIGRAVWRQALDTGEPELVFDLMVTWHHMEWAGGMWIPCRHICKWSHGQMRHGDVTIYRAVCAKCGTIYPIGNVKR